MEEPTLYEGDCGHAVCVMQRRLCAEHITIEVDGIFGANTLDAVMKFQRERGLEVDGICGRLTWWALGIDPVIQASKLITPAEFALWYLRLQRAHHCLTYLERRPMILTSPPSWPDYMDCSAFATLCYYDARWQDPNGLGYDGYGNTSTLITNGRRVHLSHMTASDLVFYRDPDHVVVYVGGGWVVSMGQQGDPTERRYDYRVVDQVRTYARD